MISSRPSDALALAVRTGTPIFANEELLDEAALDAPDEAAERGGGRDHRRVPRLHRARQPRGLRRLRRLDARACGVAVDPLSHPRNYAGVIRARAGERSDDASTGYSGNKAAQIVGITYRQLDYWARTDLSARRWPTPAGSGSRRRYSYRDLLELRVIKSLLDAGIKLESVREVFTLPPRARRRRHRRGPPRDQRHRRGALRRRRAHRRGEPCGQGVLNVLPLGGVKASMRLADRSRSATRPAVEPHAAAPPRRAMADEPRRRRAQLAARRRPPRPRRQDGARSAAGTCRWPTPAARSPSTSPAGTTRSCSTSATSARCGSRAPTRSTGCSAALTNDLGKIAPGPGAVHPPARRGDALGARRHHRVVGRRRALRRDAQRLEHRPGRAPRSAATDDDRRRGRSSPCRARGPRAAGRGVPRRRRGRPVPRRRARRGTASPCTVAGTGYTGEDGVEIAVPADAAADALGGDPRRRRRARRARAPATRCASRPRCRCTATSSARASRRCRPGSAGSWRGARATFRGRDAARGRAAQRRRAGSCGASPPRAAARRGPSCAVLRRRRSRSARSPAATSRRCSATASRLGFLPPVGRRGHQRHDRRPRLGAAGHGRADPLRRQALSRSSHRRTAGVPFR